MQPLPLAKASKVPITPSLMELLNPDLFRRESIFTSRLELPKEGEKIHSLSDEQLKRIRDMRGSVVDLHPGMGGISPDKLLSMIGTGVKLTSLDFMLTRGCNFECTWCFACSSPSQGQEYIPLDSLEPITREACDLGVSLFVLTGGEPLVYYDPKLGKQKVRGEYFFRVVDMIKNVYSGKQEPKILTFDDVALITPQIARNFASRHVGLCTKLDTLVGELQDYKVNQQGAFDKIMKGYANLIAVGYGTDPNLRLVVNSVLDHTTFDGMVDLHLWVLDRGFDHSIVPVHYCGNAVSEDQEAGIHSPHVKVLYDLLGRLDDSLYGIKWDPCSAFTYNKTCNRNRSGLHIRANGDVTACSESPSRDETESYTFGNVFEVGFSLKSLVNSERLNRYRRDFALGYGEYVCNPDVCDLYANNLCQGGCATRSAYSRIDYDTGLIVKNLDPHNYSQRREDPFCPAWTVLAMNQGILREGLLEEIHARLLDKSARPEIKTFTFV